jgi:AcrR family transcriptional regulator
MAMSRRQRRPRTTGAHTTHERILEQAVLVLTEDGFDRFSVQRVLDGAEVSRATLYNHFTDVDTLIEAALVESYARESASLLAQFGNLMERSSDRASYRAALRDYFAFHGRVPSAVRMRRAHTISLGSTRPSLAAAIAPVQDEVTAAWRAAVIESQRLGYLRADLDADAVAAIMQAIPLGRIVDDASSEQVGDERWTATLIDMVERALLVPDDEP